MLNKWMFLAGIRPTAVGEMPLQAKLLFGLPLMALWGNCIALLIYMLFVETFACPTLLQLRQMTDEPYECKVDNHRMKTQGGSFAVHFRMPNILSIRSWEPLTYFLMVTPMVWVAQEAWKIWRQLLADEKVLTEDLQRFGGFVPF
jgi:hypothetical protein